MLRRQNIEVSALLTTVNEAAGRVAMHGVRSGLLERQADAIGLPVWQIPLPWPCTNEDYQARMADACRRAVAEGFGTIAFGALFLKGVRAYRGRQLTGSGLTPVFPLWELPTAILARDMIDAGLRARLSCIDSRALDATFAGREFDRALLSALPQSAHPHPRPRNERCRPARAAQLHRFPRARCHFPRPRIRPRPALRPAAIRRPLRRKRRVPHLRLRWPHVPPSPRHRDRRSAQRGWLHLHGSPVTQWGRRFRPPTPRRPRLHLHGSLVTCRRTARYDELVSWR